MGLREIPPVDQRIAATLAPELNREPLHLKVQCSTVELASKAAIEHAPTPGGMSAVRYKARTISRRPSPLSRRHLRIVAA